MERTIISFDYAIKNVLRDKANFDILSGFLTELLEKNVTVQEVLESEINPTIPATIDKKTGKTGKVRNVRNTGKVSRIDLKAKIDDGELAVFEIQYLDKVDFMGKILFNACKAVVEQIKIGKKYDIKKVYSINISYYGLNAEDEYVFTANLKEFKGIHYDEVIPFSQNLDPRGAPKHIHPEYFLILPYNFENEEERQMKNKNRKRDFVPKKPSKSKFDEWVYVLKNSVVKSEFTAAGIQAAGEKLDMLNMTPQQKAEYEAELIALADRKSEMQTAELKGEKRGEKRGEKKGEAKGLKKGLKKGETIGMQKGEAIGMQKGEAIGLEKGEAIGLEKGEAIGLEKEKKETIIRGHNNGLSIDTIAKITDLSNEQILKILKENGLI
ncbi:MAG: Rpn family recombination-promoting nuclease/putative transposase [Marinilabiliaceae bacterium]|nr:Rpn family recombination-promoting nuclease/putative transposase [Marinilabiliaceae bacterium]